MGNKHSKQRPNAKIKTKQGSDIHSELAKHKQEIFHKSIQKDMAEMNKINNNGNNIYLILK